MNKILVAAFLFLSTFCFGQGTDINKTPLKGDWIATAYFGNATLKAEDKFKVNANIAGGFLGKEFLLNNRYSIITGITNMHVRANFYNIDLGQVFVTNNSLQIPLTFHFNGSVLEKTSYYIGAGIYGSFLYSSTFENEVQDREVEEKKLGFNFGLLGDVGIRHQFNDIFNLNIGMRTFGDQLSAYKGDKQEFKLTNVYLFEIGAGFDF